MQFENVVIAGVAHIDAPHVVSSAEIEEQLSETMSRLEIRPGLLEDVSGITERRFWNEGVQPSEVSTQAGKLALQAAGIDRSKLGILINTSVCRDYIEPSTACLVHGNLGLPATCMNFDLSNACLGFINGMDMVGNMIERDQIDCGIVVDGEGSRLPIESTISRLLEPDCDEQSFRGNFATLTLGSGATAMVLARADMITSGHRFLGGVNRAATQHSRLCVGHMDGMVTDTKMLTIAGLELAGQTWAEAAPLLGWSPTGLDHYVLHQVSKAHTDRFTELLGLDPSKIYRLYPRFGNIGPAGVPIVLSKLAQENLLREGERIALMGIGSGLNCTMAEVVW
ncbi:MAG: 3-oxoacyl-ACP synthase III [bacterium]|nr:3-oxoacyl-ACP synthase III [bacterium]